MQLAVIEPLGLHKPASPAPSVFPRDPSRKVIDQARLHIAQSPLPIHERRCRRSEGANVALARGAYMLLVRTGLLRRAIACQVCPTQLTGIVAFSGSWVLGLCERCGCCCWDGAMDSGRPGFVRAPGLGPRDCPHSPGGPGGACCHEGGGEFPAFGWPKRRAWDGRLFVMFLCAPRWAVLGLGYCVCVEKGSHRRWRLDDEQSQRTSVESVLCCISPNRFFAAGVHTRMCLVAEGRLVHRSLGVKRHLCVTPLAV